jgi:uncharacterized protein (DUF302 family)
MTGAAVGILLALKAPWLKERFGLIERLFYLSSIAWFLHRVIWTWRGSEANADAATLRAKGVLMDHHPSDVTPAEDLASSKEATDLITKMSPRSVSETVARLESLAEGKGMKVFAMIDHSGEAEKVGLELRETKVVIFGSPQAGTPVMVAVPLAALDMPLKVLIWDNDGQTNVTYTAPRALAARYGLSEELAARLAGIDGLTDALVGGWQRQVDEHLLVVTRALGEPVAQLLVLE